MGRRESRDAAVKLIYQFGFYEDGEVSVDNMVSEYIDNAQYFDENDVKKKKDLNFTQDIDLIYLKDILEGVIRENKKLDELIDKYAKGWTISRMARLDVAILKTAVYELLYRPDIPTSVVINEAVELAKKYSHKDAGSFVNGILAGICEELDRKL